MKWKKKGKIYETSGQFGWMNSHAQIPTVLVKEDRLRIYFATRPEQNLSLTTFIDVDIEEPSRIIYVHDKPILELGRAGMFDENGIMPSYVCEHEGQVWLYYGGWSRRTSIPYSNWTGLAISDDGGFTFHKTYLGPILDRTPLEVYSATGCFIFKVGNTWHMWYASGEDWIKIKDNYEEYYVIKHTTSLDGIHWIRDNKKLLPSRNENEPTHRPSVFYDNGLYHMFFCYRGITDFRDGQNSYRIGYASSNDLQEWTRKDDEAGILLSDVGWDSTMMAYPYIVAAKDRILMFYNGNGFGKSGFGYAQLER
jgi:hypothetical protein